MESNRKVGGGFRRLVRREMGLWRDEGLLTPEQFEALQSRYALKGIDEERTRTLVAVIYAIGAVLIGGGVISFVAAHWETIPKTLKVVLIVSTMLAAHGVGYWLWRVRGTRPLLGHALVALGTLIFGANIGLVAQIYHISGDFYSGFAGWAAGAVSMAYGLMSVPNAAIAVVTSFIWFAGRVDDSALMASIYPVAVLALGLPIAYVKRSRILFFLVLLAFAVSVFVAAAWARFHELDLAWACATVTVFLGSYGAYHKVVKPRPEVSSTALAFGGISLGLWSYILSFKAFSHSYSQPMWDSNSEDLLVFGMMAAVAAAGIVLMALSFAALRRGKTRHIYVFALWAGAVVIALAAGPFYYVGFAGAVLANIAFLMLATGCIWTGIASLGRGPFWTGVGLIGLLIVSRFLEYETGLVTKSFAFLLLGAAVIAGGVKFESILRARGAVHE